MKSQPTLQSERIVSLDVLRGFALLGILIMNIQSFAMVGAAYLNPMAYGNLIGANKWVWMLSHTFADMKFMSIFSMLFGAGIILFTDRLKAKEIRSLNIHYRRTFWLLLFGLAHAYLLWSGDILVAYAIAGFWVVLFRNKKPVTLFILGIVFSMVAVLLYLLTGYSIPFWDEASRNEMMQGWLPNAEVLDKELEAFRGSWLQQMDKRIESTVMMQTTVFFMQIAWRSGGLMLIGMALYKWGILTAEKSKVFYLKMAFLTLAPGLAIILYGMRTNFDAGFSMEYSFFIGSQFNYVGSILLSLAYVAFLMLCVKLEWLPFLKSSWAAVGQMALSNYLMQTLICTFIFYGHGLGLFGKVERTGQILIVFCIWILQMIISPVWMKHFRYGPFEWLWRSLTYWQLQPFKR